MSLATESTLNEIAGISSMQANNDAANDDQDKGKGVGADTNTDDKSLSGEETNADSRKDGDGAGKDKDKDKDADTENLDDDTTSKKKAPPYHKDPDFQRMKVERDEARNEVNALKAELAEFRGQMSTLMELVKGGKTGNNSDEDNNGDGDEYKDITLLSEDEIAEWQSRDPKGFAANMLAQIRAEFIAEQKSRNAQIEYEKSREANRKTYDQYVKDNPDFETMWKKGEIQEYIQKHPGHNPLSAHMALTQEKRIEEAISKKEKEIEKNIRAKLKAGTLGGGGTGLRSMVSPSDVEELKNTKSRGGIVASIAERLRAQRAAAGR